MLRAQVGDRQAIEALLRSVQPMLGARNATEKQLILLAALAVACTVFGGVFLLVLLIFRMTHKLLLAIELSARRA